MTPGAKLTNQIREAASKIGARLFTQTSGTFWNGRVAGRTDKNVTLEYPRQHIIGFTGLSDLIGGVSVEVTPDMVGQKVMVFCAVEVKADGDRASDAQTRFVDFIRKQGGRAGFARSIDDALKICRGE